MESLGVANVTMWKATKPENLYKMNLLIAMLEEMKYLF